MAVPDFPVLRGWNAPVSSFTFDLLVNRVDDISSSGRYDTSNHRLAPLS